MSEQYGAPGNAKTNPLSIDAGDYLLVMEYDGPMWVRVMWTDGVQYDGVITAGPNEGCSHGGYLNSEDVLDGMAGEPLDNKEND